jgi:hypothetical protein
VAAIRSRDRLPPPRQARRKPRGGGSSSVNNHLLAFRADIGEDLLDLNLYTSEMGPRISLTIDGNSTSALRQARAEADSEEGAAQRQA